MLPWKNPCINATNGERKLFQCAPSRTSWPSRPTRSRCVLSSTATLSRPWSCRNWCSSRPRAMSSSPPRRLSSSPRDPTSDAVTSDPTRTCPHHRPPIVRNSFHFEEFHFKKWIEGPRSINSVKAFDWTRSFSFLNNFKNIWIIISTKSIFLTIFDLFSCFNKWWTNLNTFSNYWLIIWSIYGIIRNTNFNSYSFPMIWLNLFKCDWSFF